MNTLALEPIYGSFAIALSISVILIVVVLWFTPRINDRRRKHWLTGLRLFSVLTLVLAIFRPTVHVTQEQQVPTTLVFAADQSLSMTLPDGEGKIRSEVQREAWKQIHRELESLQPHLSMRLLLYGETTNEIQNPKTESLDHIESESSLTDVTGAATQAFDLARGEALAGVILVGDGKQTSYHESESSQATLEMLRGLGIPLWTIPIGRTQENGVARDIAVDAVPESFQLFAGNESSIDFQVLAKSLTGVEIPLRLSWIDQNGKEDFFATRTVVPTTADDAISVSVPFTAPQAGSYQLKIEAEQAANEITTSNNQQIAFVETREGGGRILYLEGSSTMEQAFLRRALRRFPDLDLDYRWIPNKSGNSWPIDLDQLIKTGKYDIFILGDLPAQAIGEDQITQLSEQVDAGAGLLTLGGIKAYQSGGYQKTSLSDVLPINLDANPDITADTDRNQIEEPLLPLPAQIHPIVDLGGADINESWRNLPPLLGANRWSGTKNVPGVMTLLKSENQIPLLVIGEFGQGRVASVAFDSSWRWWSSGKSELHRRFWRQVMLWLLSRENLDNHDLIIEMDSRRFSTDAPVNATITSSNPADQTFVEGIEVTIEKPDGSALPVSISSESKQGRFIAECSLPKLSPGIYRLRATTSDTTPTSSKRLNEVIFQVIENSAELTQTNADPSFLEQLAVTTKPFGGRSYRPEELSNLCDRIKENFTNSQITVTTRFRLGEDPISGWILFLLFVVTLTTEWTLRRRWGLA